MDNKQLFHKAIIAIKNKDKNTGRRLLLEYLELYPDDENALLWLASITQKYDNKIEYLHKILKINPNNETALNALIQLEQSVQQLNNEVALEKPSVEDIVSTPNKKYVTDNSSNNAAKLPLSWDEVWLRAVINPSVNSYNKLLNDSYSRLGSKTFIWIMISSFIGSVLGLLFRTVINFAQTGESALLFSMSNTLILVLSVLVGLFLFVFNLWFSTHLVQWFAQMLGGTGEYSKLVYLRAAYLSPLGIISGPLMATPIIRYLYIIVLFYVIILDVIAVKSVNQFSWGRAIFANFLPGIVISFFACTIGLSIWALVIALS